MAQKDNFLKIWGRVKEETELATFTQLAEVVDTTHQYVSRKKAKNDFPVEWAYAVGEKYKLLTEWIMTGKGPKRLKEAVAINPLLIDVNEWLNEEKKDENEEFRILFEQQMIRAFFDYEKWKLKREKDEGSGEYFSSYKVA